MIQSQSKKSFKVIPSDDLVCMNGHENSTNLSVDLAYAHPDNFLFGEIIYRADANLFLHKDLARAVLHAAQDAYDQYGYTLVLYDGLRTTDAQALMLDTQRVKDNPHWLEKPRLLSPPGAGGHPRGMAVDVSLRSDTGELLDMGTPFDDLTPKAHRDYPNLTPQQIQNRQVLHDLMINAGTMEKAPVTALPQEWWDFRFPKEIYETYAPLSDRDLPEPMRMTAAHF